MRSEIVWDVTRKHREVKSLPPMVVPFPYYTSIAQILTNRSDGFRKVFAGLQEAPEQPRTERRKRYLQKRMEVPA